MMHIVCTLHFMTTTLPAEPRAAITPPAVVGIIFVLSVAGITASLMQTLVIPLIGDLPTILGTSASNASWVITVTLLTAAVATPVSGRLGDLYGKRRMMLVCSSALVVGSVVCALAASVLPMIIGRGLQGAGMGLIPLGISAMRDILPTEKLGTAIALMSASMGVGGALGLPIAAAVAENSSWRALFWGAAAMALLICVLMHAPSSAPDTSSASRLRTRRPRGEPHASGRRRESIEHEVVQPDHRPHGRASGQWPSIDVGATGATARRAVGSDGVDAGFTRPCPRPTPPRWS